MVKGMSKGYTSEQIKVARTMAEELLKRPDAAKERLEQAVDAYEAAKSKLYGYGICYENPYGCKIQTSYGNRFEEAMADVLDLEKAVDRAALIYQCEVLTTRHTLWQMLVEDEYVRILMMKYLQHASFEQIRRRMRYTSKSKAYAEYAEAIMSCARAVRGAKEIIVNDNPWLESFYEEQFKWYEIQRERRGVLNA